MRCALRTTSASRLRGFVTDFSLKKQIVKWAKEKADAVRFAGVDRFAGAPANHHPSLICEKAQTVIVLGRAIPRGAFRSPEYCLYVSQRSYHTQYSRLDELALDLANIIESEGYIAVPVPSYAPVVYCAEEPWGILSLKHAAVLAGMGSLARNQLFYHLQYGSRLRLSAVVTNAKLPEDPILEDKCPETCNACLAACPTGAFDSGSFDKAACLRYTIRHAIYPLALCDEKGRKNIETIFNTAGYNAWIKCYECQKVCPRNDSKTAQDLPIRR